MKNLITENEGIKIFNAAGFDVETDSRGFKLFKNGDKKYYVSNKGLLKDINQVIKFIKDDSFRKGIEYGKNSKINEFKKVFNLE